MCTVSWTFRRSGYDLFFNRDELHTRAPEEAPRATELEGVRYVAPRDGAHGGTWLLANEAGLTIGLLNDYGAPWRPLVSSRHSRGFVVRACATARTHADVIAAVERQPLAATPAFQLVALSVEEGPLVLHWRGDHLTRLGAEEARAPLSSSSFATHEVIARRQHRFHSLMPNPGRPETVDLAAYHREHVPTAGAHSVLMRRSDAATRSIIHVTVDTHRVTMDYQPVHWTDHGAAMPPSTTLRLGRRIPCDPAQRHTRSSPF